MNIIKSIAILSCILFVFGCNTKNIEATSQLITVEVQFSADSILQSEINWKDGLTALEALQHVSEVITHPIGKYVFVSQIGNSKGVRGEKAWYYEVNGKPAKVLAIDNVVNPGDKVTWIYKTDVCSKTVDI